MRQYKVVIAPTAEQELAGIIDWLAEFEDVDLQQWFEGLYLTINSLESMPYRFPEAPEYAREHYAMRKLVYREKYIVVYTILEKQHAVWVTHVKHGAAEIS